MSPLVVNGPTDAMMPVVITLADLGSDLSSRTAGASVREALVTHFQQGSQLLTVDCTGVRTLCESFADEVFGVLVAEHGKAWFRQHVAVTGLTDSTRASILRAVDERLHRSSTDKGK